MGLGLLRHRDLPAAGPAALRGGGPRAAVRTDPSRPPAGTPPRRLVVAHGAARRAQLLGVLRARLHRRLPAARWSRGDPDGDLPAGDHGPRLADPRRAAAARLAPGRCGRRGRGGAPGPSRYDVGRPTRRSSGSGRRAGVLAGLHPRQGLATAGRPADVHRLAVGGRRTPARSGGLGRRGCAARTRGSESGRLRLPRTRRNRARLRGLVPRPATAPRRSDLTGRSAQSGHRHRDRHRSRRRAADRRTSARTGAGARWGTGRPARGPGRAQALGRRAWFTSWSAGPRWRWRRSLELCRSRRRRRAGPVPCR